MHKCLKINIKFSEVLSEIRRPRVLTPLFLNHLVFWLIKTQKEVGEIFDMFLRAPRDKAIQSIRLAMSHLLQANKGLLAHRLINELNEPTCNIAGSRLYPSYYDHHEPYQVLPRGPFGRDALKAAVRQLWDACLDFEAAGMRGAAYVCLEFSAQVVRDELLTVQDRPSGAVESV